MSQSSVIKMGENIRHRDERQIEEKTTFLGKLRSGDETISVFAVHSVDYDINNINGLVKHYIQGIESTDVDTRPSALTGKEIVGPVAGLMKIPIKTFTADFNHQVEDAEQDDELQFKILDTTDPFFQLFEYIFASKLKIKLEAWVGDKPAKEKKKSKKSKRVK